jgi:hypothetical protein
MPRIAPTTSKADVAAQHHTRPSMLPAPPTVNGNRGFRPALSAGGRGARPQHEVLEGLLDLLLVVRGSP